MTLLLGPPSSGKTTLLLALAAKLDSNLKAREMIVGPTKTFFMDEISTGLYSSITYQIVKCLQQIVHLTDSTVLMSLFQPAPETYDLFDDIVLLSEGQIVYQGPRENVLEFFESCGFRCPERKGITDFINTVLYGFWYRP